MKVLVKKQPQQQVCAFKEVNWEFISIRRGYSSVDRSGFCTHSWDPFDVAKILEI